MFTGLIQKTGKVRRVSRGRGLVLEFQFGPWPEPLVKGESVAVNGVCLTVCASDATRFTADVLEETARRSTLASLLPGARVNLERAPDNSAGYVSLAPMESTAIEAGTPRSEVLEKFGEPDSFLSGLFGDIYRCEDKLVLIYYDSDAYGSEDASVLEVHITDRQLPAGP